MKKKTKIILIVVAVLLVIGMIGNLFGLGDQGEESKEAVNESAENLAETSEGANKTQETVTEPPETEIGSQESHEATGNPLLDAELMVEDVMNGSRTEKIGEYAYITVNLETMKSLTMEQYAAFCENVVQGSGYNWVTIDFGDGYGIQFQGSIPQIATYGSLDVDKCIAEKVGSIMQTESGYEYLENTEG